MVQCPEVQKWPIRLRPEARRQAFGRHPAPLRTRLLSRLMRLRPVYLTIRSSFRNRLQASGRAQVIQLTPSHPEDRRRASGLIQEPLRIPLPLVDRRQAFGPDPVIQRIQLHPEAARLQGFGLHLEFLPTPS